MIDLVQVLPQIFGHIHIPTAVAEELSAADGPRKLREWALALPSWVEVNNPVAPSLALDLHEGERQAISLALELKAVRLIIDERAGRRAAQSLGLPIVGTLGILDLAAEARLIDLRDALARLEGTNFRIARSLVEEVIDRDARRRGKK